MSSTEPYPEVSTADESGIVPPQNRSPEWPKKIRTLTATELDRLTIDSAGRFYWDGRLVNYEPPMGPTSAADKPAADNRSKLPRSSDRRMHRFIPSPIATIASMSSTRYGPSSTAPCIITAISARRF